MTEEAAFPLLAPSPNPGPMRGSLAFLHDRDGRLLLQLRDDRGGVTHPGLWSLFGGRVEAGETLLQALLRELEEELGLTLAPKDVAPLGWLQSDSPRRSRLFIFTGLVRASPADIRLGEGAGFGFFTPKQVARLETPDILKPAFEAYFSSR